MGSRLPDTSLAKSLFGFGLLVTLFVLKLVPWTFSLPAPGLDPSWKSVIEWGFLNGKGFGTDLVFTFGPLGFLYTTQYHPELSAYQLAYWFIVAVALGAFFARYWAEPPVWASLLSSVALLLINAQQRDMWFFFLPLATAVEVLDPHKRRRRWLIWLLLLLSILWVKIRN